MTDRPGPWRFGFVTGLAAEARIAARSGGLVLSGGGTPAGAAAAAEKLVHQGADALISFGFAGGLDPALRAGALVIPSSIVSDGVSYPVDLAVAARFGGCTGHRLLAGSETAREAETKRQLRNTTRAHAIDLESGSVARVARACGLPFAALRAISDPADRDLPAAALLPLGRDGAVDLWGVLGSLLAQPAQVPALVRLAFDAARARRTLARLIGGL